MFPNLWHPMWNVQYPVDVAPLCSYLDLTSGFLGWCLMSAGIQTDSVLSARLQIIRIYIREDGRLVIEFKTHAKFRGRFTRWPIAFQLLASEMSPYLAGFDLESISSCINTANFIDEYTQPVSTTQVEEKNTLSFYLIFFFHVSLLQVSLSLNTTPCRATSPTWWPPTTSEASSLTCSSCGALRPSTLRTSSGGPPVPTAGQ